MAMSADCPSLKTPREPFAEPLFPSSSTYSIEDVRAAFLDAFLTTHYVHSNFPDVLSDTLSLSDIKLHRTAGQDTVGVLVDLDGLEHPSNPSGRPSTHGTIPFNAYDRMFALRDTDIDYCDRPTLYTVHENVNSAAPFRAYRHILEALFYILLWSVSDISDRTVGWMERGHVASSPLMKALKHPKDREAFMWDASEVFKGVRSKFRPLAEQWLKPLWVLLSEAQFSCRLLAEPEKSVKLDELLTWNRVIGVLRGDGDLDLRIAALTPVPTDGLDEAM